MTARFQASTDEAAMLPGWTRAAVGGHPVDLFAPDGALAFGVLYLHSLHEETPADDPVFTAELVRHRLRCLAPAGGHSWWADRPDPDFGPNLTAERFLLDVLLPWAATEWNLGPRSIALAGVEMGGQGAVRLAFKYPDRFPVAAGIGGAFDCHDWYGLGTPLDQMYESRELCRLDTAVLHVDAARWPSDLWFSCAPSDAACYRGNDRLREKLLAMGVPHTADLDTPGGPDYVARVAPRMLEFVAGALGRAARRLM